MTIILQVEHFVFTFEVTLIDPLMRWLVILAKAAVICNVAFLLCIVILYSKNFIPGEFLKGLIIILGLVLSFIVNSIVNLAEIVLAFMRKPSPVLLWIRAINFVVFSIQIAHYFIFGNAEYL